MQTVQDTFWQGALVCWQPARRAGYRFNVDPVLLAGFTEPAAHIVDLGAGCGIVGLLLLAAGKAQRVTAVEIQPEMAELAVRNAQANGLGDRLHVINADVRGLSLSTPAHGAVFNPPYFRQREGRPSPLRARDVARREVHGTLADFVACAHRCVLPNGSVGAITVTKRSAELGRLFDACGRGAQTYRRVQPRADEPTNQLLVKAALGAQGWLELPPLVVHKGRGRDFSEEVEPWITGRVGGFYQEPRPELAAPAGLWQ